MFNASSAQGIKKTQALAEPHPRMEASQMLGFLCFRFLLRLALLYFYAGDLSASMEKILLDSVLWLKLQTISGIQSSSMDVQGVKAFRVQNRARSLYRWRRTYRSRQDRLRYAPRAKLRAQPRQETRANFSLKRNCSRRSLLDKKKKKPQKNRAVLGSGVLSCLSCRSREAVSNKTA